VFCPDRQWVDYLTHESGGYEVHVRAFPEATCGGGKWHYTGSTAALPRSRKGRPRFLRRGIIDVK
jgi:hypothetical protein